MSEEERATFEAECNEKLQQALKSDDIQAKLRKNKADFESIWEIESAEEIEPITVSSAEYKDLFPDDEKTSEYAGGKLTMNGYDALLLLVARKIIDIKE